MSAVPKVQLSGGLEICRILNGMWQLSGAHGKVDRVKAGDPHSAAYTLKAEQEKEEGINRKITPTVPVNLSAVNRFAVTLVDIFLASATTTPSPSSFVQSASLLFVCFRLILFVLSLTVLAFFIILLLLLIISMTMIVVVVMKRLIYSFSRGYAGLCRRWTDDIRHGRHIWACRGNIWTVQQSGTHTKHTLCDGGGCSLSGSSGSVCREKQAAAQKHHRLSVCSSTDESHVLHSFNSSASRIQLCLTVWKHS